MGKCRKFCFFKHLLALPFLGIHLSLPADELQDFGQGVDVFNGTNQAHVFQQCSWVPPSLANYPGYYSSSSLAQTPATLARSSFARTVESVHRIVTRFHVVRRSDGSGGVDENLLSAMMLDLNYGYRDTPFVFVRDPELIYVDNDGFFADFPTFSSAFPMLRDHFEPGVMNWFVTPKIRTQIAGTWIGPASPVRGILMRNDTIGSPSFMRLPVHEMAHIFQVLHPFETALGTECSSGSNCGTAGDLVCDTPPSPPLFPGNTTATGVYYGGGTGPCVGDPPYDPDTSVYMLGSWPAGSILADHFTQGEMDRAVDFLRPGVALSVFDLVGPERPDILADCDANGVDDINEILIGAKADINRDMEPDVCQVFPNPGDLVVSGMNPAPNNRLRYYDRESGAWRGDLWNGMNFVHQLRLGPDGLIYIPTLTIIQRVDPETGRSVDNFIDGVLEGAGTFVDLLFEPSGNLLALDNVNANVRRYDGKTGQALGIFFNIQVSGRFAPKYMEYGPDGNIYIAGNGAGGNAIYRFNATTGEALGAFVSAGSGGLQTGQGLVFHTDGFLYVSNGLGNNILRYHADTGAFDSEFVPTAGNGGLRNPHSLRFGPDGHLYVASRSTHSVKRYDGTSGEFLGDFVAPGSGGSPGTGQLNEPAGLLFINRESFVMNAGLNDAWFNILTDGQGFFITVFPNLGIVSLAWFTYDTKLPPEGAIANLGDIGHRWITAVGTIDGDSSVMDVTITSEGLFDTPTTIVRVSDGTITLTFNDCKSGTVKYNIPSINRQGLVPIRRVADDNIALCEAFTSPEVLSR